MRISTRTVAERGTLFPLELPRRCKPKPVVAPLPLHRQSLPENKSSRGKRQIWEVETHRVLSTLAEHLKLAIPEPVRF